MISLGVAIAVVGLILLISFGFKTLARGVKDLDEKSDLDENDEGEL